MSNPLPINRSGLNALLTDSGAAIRHYGVVLLDILAQVDDEGVVYYKQMKASERLGVSKTYMHKAVHALIDKGYLIQLDSKTKALKLQVAGVIIHGAVA